MELQKNMARRCRRFRPCQIVKGGEKVETKKVGQKTRPGDECIVL